MSDQTTRDTGTTGQGFFYDTAPALLANKISDRGDYVVISRTRQGEAPQVWSTGDVELTQSMLTQVQQLETI